MNKYEIILDVCQTKNVSKTASKLNYTRSAVSQIIKNYEQELGIPIFQRTKSGMELLKTAEPIIEQIQQISNAQKNINLIVSKLTSLQSGYIRIGAIQSISYHILPDLLREFAAHYPDIQFDIEVHDFQSLSDQIKEKKLDCIFTSRSAVSAKNFIPIVHDELVLITPVDHPLSKLDVLTLQDIDREDFILSADKLDYETGEIFQANHIYPNITYQLNDDFAVLKMVESGFGITILPKLLLTHNPFCVNVRSFTEHYSRILGISWDEDLTPSKALLTFLDFSKKYFSK